MTSSFQSTAFNSSARPVDTFVEEPSVLPKTGMMELAETLQAINPALQKFIGQKIEDRVDKEKRKATKDRIQFELDGGEVAKLSNNIRKTQGDDAARKIIGSSRAYRKQYEKVGVQLEALKLGNKLENDFDTFKVDTGKVDSNNQPITKFLREFESDSPEVRTWRNNKLNSAIQALEDRGVDPDAIDEFFIPSIQKQLFEIDDYATEQNQDFKFTQLQSEIPTVMDEVSQLFAKGKDEEGGVVLTEFLNNIYNAGVTGEDANKTYKMIVESAFDKGRLLIDPNKPLNLAVAENFPDRILRSIPYGNKDLTSHPSYLDEAADFSEKYEKIVLTKLQTPPKIEIELKKAKVLRGWQSINNMRPEKGIMTMTDQEIEDYNLRRQKRYNEILNNPEFSSKEVQDYAQSLGKSDNLQLINIEIPALKNKIRKGAFDGYDDILEQEIAILENNHATMDREAIGEFERLKTFAATSKGLAEDIDGSLRNIMTEIDRNLGTKGGLLVPNASPDFAKSTKIRFEMQTKLTEYYQNFIETKGRRPSSLERQNIERQYFLQMAAREEVGEITNEFADKIFPPAVLDEEGNIKSGFENPFIEKQPLTPQIKKIDPRQFDNGRNTNEFMEQGMFDPGVASEISDEEAERIITAEDANDYLVQAGDTLSAIAESFGITVRDIMDANNITDADLINIGQQLTIPEPKPLFIDQYKGKAIPDFGGLGKLVISGESAGHGIYNAFNKGTTASAGTMDITSKTIAEMEQMQSEGKVFAVGAYQLTPGVLTEAREVAGIDSDAIMTPAVQDRLFWGMLTGGQKRPKLTAYLLGESDDLNAAHEALALEFAVIQGPDGKGRYDKDKSGNVARIKAALVKQALIKARKEISNK